MILSCHDISKAFGDHVIVANGSFHIEEHEKAALVGVNGAGKTTLIKLLTKKLEPDSGFVRIGKNLEEAYFDQNRFSLDPSKTLWQTLCDEGDHIWVRGSYRHVVAYLKDFLFTPEQAKAPVAALSGGEKNRLMLAKVLAQPSNFLLLDEPTNDLDMDTLDLLQEMLSDYDGTILIVSHDRDFLDKIVTSIIYMKGDGKVEEYVGSYSDLLERFGKQPATAAKNKPAGKNRNEPSSERKETSRGRLSYNQQRLLQVLPQQIAALEQKIENAKNDLCEPTLYQNDPDRFYELTRQLEEWEKQKEDDENQWLEISLLAEELGIR